MCGNMVIEYINYLERRWGMDAVHRCDDACSPTVPPSGPGLHATQRRALARAQLCKYCVKCKHAIRPICGVYTPMPLLPSVERANLIPEAQIDATARNPPRSIYYKEPCRLKWRQSLLCTATIRLCAVLVGARSAAG